MVMGTRVHRWGRTGPESYEQGGGHGTAGARRSAGEKGEAGGGETPGGQRLDLKHAGRALGQWSGWT